MKKWNSLAFVMILLAGLATTLQAQRNPRGTAKFEKNDQYVMVEYGRPSLKGRDMLAQLQTGKAWRMGADKSTTFTCSANVSFGIGSKSDSLRSAFTATNSCLPLPRRIS